MSKEEIKYKRWFNQLLDWATLIQYNNVKRNPDKLLLLLMESRGCVNERELKDELIVDGDVNKTFGNYQRCSLCKEYNLYKKLYKCDICGLEVFNCCINQPNRTIFCNKHI